MGNFQTLIKPFVVEKTSDSTFDQGVREALSHQEWVRQEFPLLLAKSHLHLWSPGQPVSQSGIRILIGVMAYSQYDLKLLDEINAAVVDDRLPCEDYRIDVFEGSQLSSGSEIECYVPGIGQVLAFPVVGWWENGELQYNGWGPKARQELLARLGMRVW
jgi:hypothetical protein